MIFIVLLLLLFIIVCIHLLSRNKEGFQDAASSTTLTESNPLFDKNMVDTYQSFSSFYNPFMINWEKAIITAASQEVQRPPLQSPDEAPSGTPPTISRNEQNAYIAKLSEQLKKPLPPITDPLPASTSLNLSSLPMLMNTIPKDTAPYQHALDWMNNQLGTAQDNLKKALKGIPFNIETFQSQCGNVSQCLLNNQEFITKVGDEVCSSERNKGKKQLEELVRRMNAFITNKSLLQANERNKELVKGAEKVKNDAESGELYKQVQIQDRSVYTAPMTADDLALSNLEKTNPEKYNELKTNYRQWFDLKSLMQQLSRSIR
jgi:hypothetical protein